MQSDYAKTQDEILKIQENIMNGYNAPSDDQSDNHALTETSVTSDGILKDTLDNKYSNSKGSNEIGLCKYPELNKIYCTNRKLFNNDVLTDEENNNGLVMLETIDLMIDQLTYFQHPPTTDLFDDNLIGEIDLSSQNLQFESKNVEKVSTLPSITKPELVINKQLKVHISFDHFFKDYNYTFAERLWEGQEFEYTKEYFQQFGNEQSDLSTITVYKNGELPIWGVNIYTDDSNPLGILRHCAVYEKIEKEDKVVGCKLIGFNKINGFHELKEPIEVYFNGHKEGIVNRIKPVDFVVTFKYMPTLNNYYGSNVAFERNGVMPRNWYGSQFLSGHDGLSIAIWDIECIY